MDPTEGQGGLVVKEHINVSELLIRREKNRERQRRYRARKRLEADKLPVLVNHPALSQLAVQLKEIPSSNVRRVYCKRDWKKDARLAQMRKFQEQKLSASMQSAPHLTTERQPLCLTYPSGTKQAAEAETKCHSESSLVISNSDTGISKTKLGRRNWKADARNKKS